MAKTFRPWEIDQQNLFPPSVRDFVPAGHLAHFVRDLVREDLDLDAIMREYDEERGFPPYHPAMMVALLLYAYCRGVYASRRIATACEERVDFIAVTGMQRPDFRTIAKFRKRHLTALGDLFVQILALCDDAGLVKLGHVALDGTKVRANASKRKAMSYERMKKRIPELEAQVKEWLQKAADADDADDAEHGDARGDELPDWVTDKAKRVEKLKAAKAKLEAMARAEDEARRKRNEAEARGDDDDDENKPQSRRLRFQEYRKPPGTVKDKAQINFTDDDSRVMLTNDGFQQCYTGAVAVDHAHQIIVARTLTNEQNDTHQLIPLIDQAIAELERRPDEVSADANFCSEQNLKALRRRRIRAYVATGRQTHDDDSPTKRSPTSGMGPLVKAMATQLKRAGHRSRYRLRKSTVEPVFGQIKEARGFRRFLLRGLENVGSEWSLICAAHNVLKLAAAT